MTELFQDGITDYVWYTFGLRCVYRGGGNRTFIALAVHEPNQSIFWRPRDDHAANARYSVNSLQMNKEILQRLCDDCTEIALLACNLCATYERFYPDKFRNES